MPQSREKQAEYRAKNREYFRRKGREWYNANRERSIAASTEWAKANPEKKLATRRKSDRRAKYGIEPHEVEAMKITQDCKCAICKTKFEEEPHVDHCHSTGRVRGLLCRKCNLGLGYFADDPDRLRAAAEYLK